MPKKLAFLTLLIVAGFGVFLIWNIAFNSPSYIEDSNSSQLSTKLHARICAHYYETTVSPAYACGKYDVRYGARKGLSIIQVFGIDKQNEQEWVVLAVKEIASQTKGLARIDLVFYEQINSQSSPIRTVTVQEQ